MTPTRRLQYLSSLMLGGSSTKSRKGFSVKVKVKVFEVSDQPPTSAETPRNILKPILAITSAVCL